MLSNGTYTGMVDRFEEDAAGTEIAVILLEEDHEVIEQVDVPRADLPPELEQDAVLEVTVIDGELTDVEYDPVKTKSRTEAVQNRFDRLARRPPGNSDTDTNENSQE